ncbi:MAG: hypothetical protein J6C46_08895 [Clostridia bacterium]|nr:hypothetical protein [Clostridia bacterium]
MGTKKDREKTVNIEEKSSRKCRPSPFTNQEILNELIKDYNSGMSWKQMESKYETSHGTVHNALKEAGALVVGKRRKVLTPEMTDTSVIVRDYKSRMSIKNIGKKYRLSTKTITFILEEAGAKPVGTRSCIVFRDEKKIEALVKAYKEGMSWRKMKDEFNASGTTIARTLKIAGIETGNRKFAPEKGSNKNRKRKPRIRDKETIEQIITDYKNKMPYKEMEKKYHVTAATIIRLLRNEGIDTSRRRKSSRSVELDEEKKKLLVQAYKDKKTWKEICSEFGFSETQGRKLLKDMGITMTRTKGYSEEERKQILKLYEEENKSLKELAYLYCDTVYHIERMLKSCGATIRQEDGTEFVTPVRRVTDEDKKKIFKLRDEKWSIHEIAKELNLSYDNVSHYFKKRKKRSKKKY